MKTQTSRLWTATLLATSLSLFAGQSFAQSDTPPAPDLRAQHVAQRTLSADAPTVERPMQRPAMQQEKRQEKRQQRMAERQAQLKTMLSITPEQEPAWNAFVARTQPAPRADRHAERQAMAQLTTPERLDKMQARQAERQAVMAQRIEATRRLYSVLSPDQQKRFDTQTAMHMQRSGMKGKHRHGEGHEQNHRGQNAPRG